MNTDILSAQRFTDRDLIESIVNSFFIVDFGFVTKVNQDGTVNVTHAIKNQTLAGETLPETQTNEMEVLTLSCGEFAVKFTPKTGDKVLLLGMKEYVKNTADVKTATLPDVFLHYSQNTMKALPISAFNSEAKIKLEVDDGKINLTTDGEITIDAGSGNVNVKTTGDATLEAGNVTAKCSSFKVSNSGGTSALEVTP